MAQLTCIVVTPEETAFEQEAEFVALPLFDGDHAGLFNHLAPRITDLSFLHF